MTYKYKGISFEGLPVKGTVEASDEYAAIVQMKQSCQIVTQIAPMRKISAVLSKEIGSRQIDFRTLTLLCSQFSYILKSGIPLAKSVELIAHQTENKKLKKFLEEVKERVVSGQGLADSFQDTDEEAFPITFLETIRAGESSGALEKCFENLADYYEKQYQMKQKVSAAMTYPSFVLAVAFAVIAIVMAKVIPTLTEAFSELGGELPLSTKLLIGVSNFFQVHFLHGILLTAAIALCFLCGVKTEEGRILWSWWKLKAPVFGKIRMFSAASQFSYTMSVLLHSGLTLTHTMDITARTMENYRLSREIVWMAKKLREGYLLGDCMRERNCFPEALTEICAIGEETGELEEMLKSIGDYFDNQAEYATKKAIARLEPGLLVALAVVTGFIVISVYTPLFAMYNLM